MTNEALALLLAVMGGLVIGVVTASAMWRQKLDRVLDDLDDVLNANLSASLRIDELEAQVSRFDHDGDGKPGGSKPKS